jgi:hypothetical protein
LFTAVIIVFDALPTYLAAAQFQGRIPSLEVAWML